MSDTPMSKSPTPSPVPKTRLQRILSITAILFGCSFFACAGCCLLGMVLLGPKNFDTAEGAQQVAEQITTWTLPQNFTGKSGATMDNYLMRFDVARFVQKQGRGNLVVGQFHYKLLPTADLQLQLKDIMEKLNPDLKKIDLAESETKTRPINGGIAKFQIGQGEDRATTTRYKQLIGQFRGKLNNAIVILECEEGFLTDQEINDFIDSIH